MSIDKENLTVILEMQQKIYKDASEILFNSLHNRIEEQNKVICELRKSLEYSQLEVEEIKKKVNTSQLEIDTLKMTVNDQKTLIEETKNQQEYQEDYSRRMNIRIDGVADNKNENNEQTQHKIGNIIMNNLGMENIEIAAAHRITKNHSSPNPSPRTIIATLKNSSDRDEIMKSTKKLKNSGIYINEDFCEATLKIRKGLFPKVKEAREKGFIAYIRRRTLVIKKRHTEVSNTLHTLTPSRQVSTLSLDVTPTLIKNKDNPPSSSTAENSSLTPERRNVVEVRKSQRQKK